MVPTRAIPFGASVALALALSACGDSLDSPLVLLGPEDADTTDTLRVQFAERAGVEYEVVWTVDGVEVDGVDREIPSTETARDQTWQVSVTPTDTETGESFEPGVATVTIGNAAPTGTAVLVPAEPKAGVDLVAVPAFIDPDGDEVSASFSWKKNGTDAGISGDTVPGDQLVKGDTWEVSIVGSDGSVDSDPAITQAQVGNTAPTIAGARIVPDQIFDDTDVECRPVAWFDPDGDPEGYTYVWSVNGVEVSTDAVLTGDKFDRGQRIVCELTPNDGEALGPSVTSRAVAAENAAPSIGSVTIDQAEPSRAEALTFTANDAVDADGDEIEYAAWWLVNGRGVSQEMSLHPDLYRRGDVVQVMVTPTDGSSDGEMAVSSEVTILNAPPEIVSSVFNADPIYTDTVLTPRLEWFDADGDEVTATYAWEVNGSAAGDATGTLDGNVAFDRGDTVAYTVTLNDGLEDGDSFASTTENVINKPPSDPVLGWAVEPTTPDDDLHCMLVEPSVDADGDTVTYDIVWDKNGSAYLGLTDTTDETGDTIPYAELELKQDWVCYVVASDGTDDSNTMELETKIRPENLWYFAEDSGDISGMSSSCTQDGETGYYGYDYYSYRPAWKFSDDYDVDADRVTFRWRQGRSSSSSTYRYVYFNGTYIGYVNLGVASSSTCDSGRTYGVTISGMRGIWNEGGTNTIEIGGPCCSYYYLGVFPDADYQLGRMEPYEE